MKKIFNMAKKSKMFRTAGILLLALITAAAFIIPGTKGSGAKINGYALSGPSQIKVPVYENATLSFHDTVSGAPVTISEIIGKMVPYENIPRKYDLYITQNALTEADSRAGIFLTGDFVSSIASLKSKVKVKIESAATSDVVYNVGAFADYKSFEELKTLAVNTVTLQDPDTSEDKNYQGLLMGETSQKVKPDEIVKITFYFLVEDSQAGETDLIDLPYGPNNPDNELKGQTISFETAMLAAAVE